MMRKIVVSMGALAGFAMPLAAHASGKPIACLYDHVAHSEKIERGTLETLVAHNMAAQTNEEKLAMARIGGEMGKCQSQYGWSQNRQHAVFAYLHARLLYDFQHDALDAHHITYKMIDGVTAAMSPDLRNSYSSGSVNRAMIEDAVVKLNAAGGSIDAAAAADQTFDVALAKALVASIVEANAENSFAGH